MSELLFESAMATPSSPLPKALLPVASVPMKLPLSKLPVEAPLINTPLARLPEIRLPCGGVWKTALRGIFAAGRIIDPGRLTANEISRRCPGDQNAVQCVAEAGLAPEGSVPM